ncbi:transcriptional regulator [Helicobacter sp. 13S00477-4]|uniref:transcriptional regulator n=1 Tax=Helicobacter sp. 13S00477-4 TaxID=1905759 RepID=UPI000BA53143|nr:transcriptional regulator [Helicobacter sp. 13S00477-4]PAF50438.1 hypothetical protein BKH44_08380 [Helicobacter sp. 13S00477-4]
MSNEQNLIKKTAKELGMTYKELGEAIGYSEATLKSVVSTNSVSQQIEKVISLYVENQELHKKIETLKNFKDMLNNI